MGRLKGFWLLLERFLRWEGALSLVPTLLRGEPTGLCRAVYGFQALEGFLISPRHGEEKCTQAPWHWGHPHPAKPFRALSASPAKLHHRRNALLSRC